MYPQVSTNEATKNEVYRQREIVKKSLVQFALCDQKL